LKTAVVAMLAFSLRRRVGGVRFLGALAIALLPTLNLVLDVAFGDDPTRQYDLYLKYIVPICLYFVTPFVTMMTMLPVLGELYEKGSIGYLYTRPAPRLVPLLGLYLGGVVAMLVVFFTAAFVPAAFGALMTDAAPPGRWLATASGLFGTLCFAALAYGAVCLFLGVWTRRAILCAAILLLGWGVVVGFSPGPLRETSLHHYLFGLARSWCGVAGDTFTGIFPPVVDPPTPLTSILVLLGATAAFLLLAAREAERRDVM
jgi:ABC-type transport system involved in multi-copper enzyme maturation permease subunit